MNLRRKRSVAAARIRGNRSIVAAYVGVVAVLVLVTLVLLWYVLDSMGAPA